MVIDDKTTNCGDMFAHRNIDQNKLIAIITEQISAGLVLSNQSQSVLQRLTLNPTNHTNTDDLGSLARDFQVMIIFFIILLFTHSQQGIRGTPCTAYHTSLDFTQSQLQRMVRAASLV